VNTIKASIDTITRQMTEMSQRKKTYLNTLLQTDIFLKGST